MEIVIHLSMRNVVIRMTHVTLEGWEISSYGNLTSSQEMGAMKMRCILIHKSLSPTTLVNLMKNIKLL